MAKENDVKLDVENFFQCDGGEFSEFSRENISIRCPHCRELGSFVTLRPGIRYFKNGTRKQSHVSVPYFATVRICPNKKCRGLLFVIESNEGEVVEVEPPQVLDFNPEGLDDTLLRTLKEAIVCHGAGAYRAAAMMVRRLLEEICEANSATGPNLHQRLIALKSKIVLPQELFDAMSELKALGNDAAHVEAKEYNKIGPEEAEDSIELAKEILKALYQLKGLVARLQARKASTP